MEWIDSHVHLDDPQYQADLSEVIRRAHEVGVGHMITVGTDLESCARAIRIAGENTGVSAAVGCHPHEGDRYAGTDWLDRLRELAGHPRVVAIGETGLDHFKKFSAPEHQEALFLGHLQIARARNKPIVIHCRDGPAPSGAGHAHDRCIEILRAEMAPPVRGVVHCFSGTADHARKYLDLGMLISIAGPVTYPNAHRLREVVRTLPPDRVGVETDGPYLTPQIHRGKRNEPAYVVHTAQAVAALLSISPETFAENSTRAVAHLMGLSSPGQVCS